MGIFMDMIEENFERKIKEPGERIETWKVRFVALHYCPVCGAASYGESDLQNHLFRYHRNYQSYIKVNQRIVTKESILNEAIYRIEVFYTGSKSLEGKWRTKGLKGNFMVNGHSPLLLFPSDKLPLIDDQIEIYLGSGHQEHVFRIVQTNKSRLRYDRVENIYFMFQQKYVSDKDRFVWSDFRNSFQRTNFNMYELRFMQGLFDYLYATHLEFINEDTKAARLYEHSNAQLAPFPTLLAHTIRTIIAYKLNWYKRLEDLPSHSIFYPLGLFFKNNDSELVDKWVNKLFISNSDEGVYIDEFHFVYRQAVVHYLAKEFEQVKNCIELLKKTKKHGSILQQQKFQFLEERFIQAVREP